jgi:hypothetical protein
LALELALELALALESESALVTVLSRASVSLWVAALPPELTLWRVWESGC